MNTQELEAELKRRKTKHNIKVGQMVVALDYDEMLVVQEQLEPFLKPLPVMRTQITYP